MKKFKLLNDYVLLEEGDVLQEVLDSGIIIPSTRKENVIESTIIGLSEKAKAETGLVDTDHVIHRNGIGTAFDLNRKNMLAVRYTDLIAKVTNE